MSTSHHTTEAAVEPQQSTGAYTVYTVAQVAEILQVDPRTVQTKIKAGTWPHLRIGPKTIRFTAAHLDAILAAVEAPIIQPSQHRPRRRRAYL